MQHNDLNALMRGYVAALFQSTWRALMPFHRSAAPRDAGIYVLAFSEKVLTGEPVAPEDVMYVGMSNALEGVSGRLWQFVSSIEGHPKHSAGNRFFREILEERPFSRVKQNKQLYVAFLTLPCERSKESRTKKDLEMMGHVACLEYYVIGHIKHACHHEPWLNAK